MKFNIKQIRTAQGLSQETLAIRSGVARCVLSALESGEDVNAETATLEKIAKVLNAKVGNLLSEDHRPETASTSELVTELETREGIERIWVKPYRDAEIKVNGPAVVLIVTD